MSAKKDHQPANSILDKLIAKDAEVIDMVFFSPSIYRQRLDLVIQETLQETASESHSTIIRYYLQHLFKSGCKRLKEMRQATKDLPFEQLLQDDFIFFLVHRKSIKTDFHIVEELLKYNDDRKIADYMWGNGAKYDDMIHQESIIIQRVYGKPIDEPTYKSLLHDYLYKRPRHLFMKFDFLMSLDQWCQNTAHHFIEGKPRIDLIMSQQGASLNTFLRKECGQEKIVLEKIVDSFKINGVPFISFDDFVQTYIEKIIRTKFKDFEKFNYECSIFSYVSTITRNLLLSLKHEEEKRLGLQPTKLTKKCKREELVRVKAQELEHQALLLINALMIPGSKEYFEIDKEDETLEAMKYIMEEIHLKCSTNEEKRERRKTLRNEFGKSDGYINLMEFRAKEIVAKIQSKLLSISKEQKKRVLSPIEDQLYEVLLKPMYYECEE